jgi:hypothetical protein
MNLMCDHWFSENSYKGLIIIIIAVLNEDINQKMCNNRSAFIGREEYFQLRSMMHQPGRYFV